MKVAVKNKSEWKYIDSGDIEVGDVTLKALLERLHAAEQAYTELVKTLHGKFIVKADTPYLVQVGDTLEKVDALNVFEAQEYDLPLKYYKVVNGEIVVDNKKVGAV